MQHLRIGFHDAAYVVTENADPGSGRICIVACACCLWAGFGSAMSEFGSHSFDSLERPLCDVIKSLMGGALEYHLLSSDMLLPSVLYSTGPRLVTARSQRVIMPPKIGAPTVPTRLFVTNIHSMIVGRRLSYMFSEDHNVDQKNTMLMFSERTIFLVCLDSTSQRWS